MKQYGYYELYFTTATIKGWKWLLKQDKYKDVVISSLRFFAQEKSIVLYSFVIMPNHIHLIWQIQEGYTLEKIQQRMLKYTAQEIKFDLERKHPKVLAHFKVEKFDRMYQIWKDKPLSIELCHDEIVAQKMNYLHDNPIQPKWNLAEKVADYRFSSGKFYLKGYREWDFLTNFWLPI